MRRFAALGIILTAVVPSLGAQEHEADSSTAGTSAARCARSVVLRACSAPLVPDQHADPQRDRLREKLQRNAARLQQRAQSPAQNDGAAFDLGTVVVEGQAEEAEKFSLERAFPKLSIRRHDDAVVTDERGLFGSRSGCVAECVGPFCCGGSAGIPAAGQGHWSDGR